MSLQPSPIEIKLLEQVLNTKKYNLISTEFILRIGNEELEKRKSFHEALKETKKRLHQVAAAYRINPLSSQDMVLLQQAKESSNIEIIKNCCRDIISKHSSTAERLSIIDSFYSRIFAYLPPIHSLLDVACGLNPLTFFWMPNFHQIKYLGWDIYSDLVDFINRTFSLFEISGKAELVDILGIDELPKVDLTLILKSLPCVEQIQKNAAIDLIRKIRSPFSIISFPTRSLSGKGKGMIDNYPRIFSIWMSNTQDPGYRIIERFDFQNEIAFLLERNPQ